MGSKKSNVRVTDAKARVTLPAGFANCTLLVEQPDPNTVVLRKAVVAPVGGGADLAALFARPPAPENVVRLSGADADVFQKALANPPEPNAALKKLMRPRKKR